MLYNMQKSAKPMQTFTKCQMSKKHVYNFQIYYLDDISLYIYLCDVEKIYNIDTLILINKHLINALNKQI